MLFEFSLRGKAQKWLNDISVTEWYAIAQAFLTKYFLPNKDNDLVDKLTTFKQEYEETLAMKKQDISFVKYVVYIIIIIIGDKTK